MANPATITRVTPSSGYMKEGHSTKIAFSARPQFSAWEIEVQPPGIDRGDPINITTMHNTVWETMYAKVLKTLTSFNLILAYSLEAFDDVTDFIIDAVDWSITCHFPGGDKLDVFAFMQSFIPQSHKRGELPTANSTIVPTNFDRANNVEAGPVLTLAAGTP